MKHLYTHAFVSWWHSRPASISLYHPHTNLAAPIHPHDHTAIMLAFYIKFLLYSIGLLMAERGFSISHKIYTQNTSSRRFTKILVHYHTQWSILLHTYPPTLPQMTLDFKMLNTIHFSTQSSPKSTKYLLKNLKNTPSIAQRMRSVTKLETCRQISQNFAALSK
jgi:hypothetical protein